MKKIRHIISLGVAALFLVATLLPSQRVYGDEVAESSVEILGRLNQYYGELQRLSSVSVVTQSRDSLQQLSKSLKMADLKWNGYYMGREQVIGSDESMLEIVVEWQILKERVDSTLNYRQGLCDAKAQVETSKQSIEGSTEQYDKWVEEAVALSLSKSLAKQLEKLKADEMLKFESVSGSYDQAKQLATQYGELSTQVDSLNVAFLEIKRESEIIQAQEFKPFFARIKDYLMGLAAVTMILMFLNMVHTKIKAAKAEGKKLKNLKKMMEKGEKQYPTI